MPRLLTSLLVMLLGAWPVRSGAPGATLRTRRGRRLPTLADGDPADGVEAPERARARTTTEHHWAGEVIFSAGTRREVVPGRWRLTLDPAQRARLVSGAGAFSLDPSFPEVWETQLEALITLQLPGTRLAVTSADARGWQLLELRAPTSPETVVQLDRAAVAQLFDADAGTMQVELRVAVR